jgi:hypothetical protein
MRFLRWLRTIFARYAPGAGAFLPWAGGVLLAAAAIAALIAWSAIRGELRATATVTENVTVMSANDGILYTPRFRFRTTDGELIQVLANEHAEEAEFPAGSVVPVLYSADHPERAVIATTWRIYSVAILMGVSGAILFDVGFLLRIVLRRKTLTADR